MASGFFASLDDIAALMDDVAVVWMKDGTVNVYGQGVYDTSDYKGIIDVACGDDFILGLKNDGTLIISNDDMKKTADKFSDCLLYTSPSPRD